MNRENALLRLQDEIWDVLVIGGGSTGLGTAVDAASRGYKTVLVEQSDFAKATSSRSTKLIHGGVRYLAQGNVSLVRESLHERGLLLRNAPELVRPLEFIIPAHSWTERLYYAAGLKAYDLLAGKLGMAHSRILSRAETVRRVPTLNGEKFSGGISYFDAQFDDARLAIALAQKVLDLDGVALNYVQVSSLMKEGGKVTGAEVQDRETGRSFRISAKSTINATGIFTDEIRRMDDGEAKPTLSLSQGAHIVVDRSFLPGGAAIIVPKTDDGRVLFLIPWHGSTVIGTTDIPVSAPELEPRPLKEEVEFLIEHANRYLAKQVQRSDVRSCFAGLRPLVKSDGEASTSKLSRDHVIRTSATGLVSISGGKWTTFRKMGQDAVDAASKVADLPMKASQTESLKFSAGEFKESVNLQEIPVLSGDFVRESARHAMARTVEDVLARRSRLLFVNAQDAILQASEVARTLAEELQRDEHWVATQVSDFEAVASRYLLP
ncbi:FAD-dependent oxidoreductase [Planctomicrobium sp. SH668]|uniref:glycerol-3-phosphate dehydrogenase/oxidase n=1 Tax=Planctomicrobium sp. SH668 TaxID=3448126 RepID=UPI003F5B200C